MKAIIQAAAEAIQASQAILIMTGAGMGVDSGLPDFRGDRGFWRAYPVYQELGLRFEELANPKWFREDPEFAWGFYGHRLNLYRRTQPHAGYGLMQRWIGEKDHFVFTSNVDSQFQKAGFDPERIFEVHGSLFWLQCTEDCREVWPAPEQAIALNPAESHALGPLPQCPSCGALARPNLLMFMDYGYISPRRDEQEARLDRFLERHRGKMVLIEIGAGTAVSTVRRMSNYLQENGSTLIRINPREAHGPRGTLSIEMPGLAALEAIDAQLGQQ